MKSKKGLLALLGLILVGISIPATLFILQQRQETKTSAFAVCPMPLDIMLVVDTSTSMSRYPETAAANEKKLDGAIKAATDFVNLNLATDTSNATKFKIDRMGLAYFNSSAQVTQTLTDNKTTVLTAINNLKTSVAEGTRIHKGVEVAMNELLAKQQPNREMVMIILSDGMLNPNPDEFRAACQGQYPVTDASKCTDFNTKFLYPISDLAKAHGMKLITIGFGKLEDHNDVTNPENTFKTVLEKVATTPADFHYSPDNAGLATIFTAISQYGQVCECNYESRVEIRDSVTDKALKLDGFKFKSTVTGTNGKVTGPTEAPVYDAESLTSSFYKTFSTLPVDLKSTANSAELSTIKAGYEIVDTFCLETYTDVEPTPGLDLEKGCPALYANNPAKTHGPKATTISNFNINCDRAITYGWRVKLTTTPPPPVTKIPVCEDGACIESTISGDTRTRCAATEVGRNNVAACLENVCNTQNACVAVFIEDYDAETDVTCDVPADCLKPQHKACVDLACNTVEGPGRDNCVTPEDCQYSLCVNESCQPRGFGDINLGQDILCDNDNECSIRNVCHNMTCIEDRSAGTDECSGDDDCEITYKICVNMACVEKVGDKESTCEDDEDCYKLVCDDTATTCEKEEGEGADECKDDNDCASPTHKECSTRNTCEAVDGFGADECSGNDDCALPEHNECSTQETCELVDGFGSDECTDDIHCQQPDHKECTAQETCGIVAGPGQNECASNTDCETPTHLACTTNETCAAVTGPGQNQCRDSNDCKTPEHKECVGLSCSLVTGPGQNLCENDANCAPPTYLACVNETCSTLTGIPAQSTKLCTTSADCVIPVAPVLTYKACLNETCVTLSGTPVAGTQLCDTDAECVIPAPPKIETGVNGEALAIAVGTVVLLLLGIKLIF